MFDFNAESQERFNKSCADAMVNYMQASGAAYCAMANQMLEMWGQSTDAVLKSAQAPLGLDSGKSAMQQNYPGLTRSNSSQSCMMPWAAVPKSMMDSNPMASFNPMGIPYGMFSPMNNWMKAMMPANATSWPMAVGMISFGVPEQVAWPTARANMAAMDAFNVAAGTVEKAMNDYRSEVPQTGRFERMETKESNPFQIMFSVMPFDPEAMMQMFKPPGKSGR